jgi:hypothetical protein
MKRPELTQHTVRCPLEDCTASLTVLTDPDGYPSRRHRDVAACSLRPSTPFVLPTRHRYFPDAMPPASYLCDVDATPRHSPDLACARRCLAVLNAAEPGAREPVRCASGVSDGLELIRATQSPAVTRLLYFYSA